MAGPAAAVVVVGIAAGVGARVVVGFGLYASKYALRTFSTSGVNRPVDKSFSACVIGNSAISSAINRWPLSCTAFIAWSISIWFSGVWPALNHFLKSSAELFSFALVNLRNEVSGKTILSIVTICLGAGAAAAAGAIAEGAPMACGLGVCSAGSSARPGTGGSIAAAATFPIGCTAVRGRTGGNGAMGGNGAIGGSIVCCLTTASSKLLLAVTATGSSCALLASVGAPCTAFVVCTALKKRKATSAPVPKRAPSITFLNLPSKPTSLGSDFK